jgi:hypothetical protein
MAISRPTAAPPTYPVLGVKAARQRLADLERQIREVDRRLSQGADLETIRVALETEYTALDEAITTLRELVPRAGFCADCGKRSHGRQAEAERHAAALRLINERGDEGPVHVYARPYEASFHVGHRAKRRGAA